jgi:hypothetical protein
MTINLKGVNQFQIESCHHFIVTTNKENGGLTTKKDDRRKLIIRSGDELIGNKKYFDKMYQLLVNIETIRTSFDYFNLQNYNHKEIPVTDLKELSVSAPEIWLEAFTRATVPNVYKKGSIVLK